jgi:hypothetical protein
MNKIRVLMYKNDVDSAIVVSYIGVITRNASYLVYIIGGNIHQSIRGFG